MPIPAFILNWKTSILGVAGVIAIIAKWVQNGQVDFTDIPTILAGIGLVAAKDASK